MQVIHPKSHVWIKQKIAHRPLPSRLKTFPWETSATVMRPMLMSSPWRWDQCVSCAGASRSPCSSVHEECLREILLHIQYQLLAQQLSMCLTWNVRLFLINDRQMTVMSGNQLVECQECHNLYHQECHKPQVTDKDVNDPRLVWYCARCTRQMRRMVSTPIAFTPLSHHLKTTLPQSQGSTDTSSSSLRSYWKVPFINCTLQALGGANHSIHL